MGAAVYFVGLFSAVVFILALWVSAWSALADRNHTKKCLCLCHSYGIEWKLDRDCGC